MQFSLEPKLETQPPASRLRGKNVVVIGGSRGLGRVILNVIHAAGARVLAVGRDFQSLEAVAREVVGSATLAIDATDDEAPSRVFETLDPDVLVVCAGAIPSARPLHEQTWAEFSINWETDVKASFHFCKAALIAPLRPDSLVILISSGAAIGGSPISGGYAGAKRMQMFLANYAQKESDRLGLGLRFIAVAPAFIMPDTDVGKAAVRGYSHYLGMTPAEFVQGMRSGQTPKHVANAIVKIASDLITAPGNSYIVSSKGVERGP